MDTARRPPTYVTQPFTPPLEAYVETLQTIWQRQYFTNHGPCVQAFEDAVRNALKVEHFRYVSNGTTALQLALKTLEITGEVITTPFSYVATTSAILWQGATPRFADICRERMTLDPQAIEAAITEHTQAILATHVYGLPCDVEAIDRIATKHNLRVIYDAAHAFGVRYKGQSLLAYGDMSALSFHATKVLHTAEGGGIISRIPQWHRQVGQYMNLGHDGPYDFSDAGINGKPSELHAALGLCNLQHWETIQHARKTLCETYDACLRDIAALRFPHMPAHTQWNYSYYPIIVPSYDHAQTIIDTLAAHNMHPKRYFHPALNTLRFVPHADLCPVAEDICQRVLCLPLAAQMDVDSVRFIAETVATLMHAPAGAIKPPSCETAHAG